MTLSLKTTVGVGDKLVTQKQKTSRGDFQSPPGPAAVRCLWTAQQWCSYISLSHAAVKT